MSRLLMSLPMVYPMIRAGADDQRQLRLRDIPFRIAANSHGPAGPDDAMARCFEEQLRTLGRCKPDRRNCLRRRPVTPPSERCGFDSTSLPPPTLPAIRSGPAGWSRPAPAMISTSEKCRPDRTEGHPGGPDHPIDPESRRSDPDVRRSCRLMFDKGASGYLDPTLTAAIGGLSSIDSRCNPASDLRVANPSGQRRKFARYQTPASVVFLIRFCRMESLSPRHTGSTRREFLKQVAAATTLATVALGPAATNVQAQPATDASSPWYRRTARWGQTNITEADVDRYDIAWWRKQWKRTEVQGVVINAGGIVAYYPSKFPLHYRPHESERSRFVWRIGKSGA